MHCRLQILTPNFGSQHTESRVSSRSFAVDGGGRDGRDDWSGQRFLKLLMGGGDTWGLWGSSNKHLGVVTKEVYLSFSLFIFKFSPLFFKISCLSIHLSYCPFAVHQPGLAPPTRYPRPPHLQPPCHVIVQLCIRQMIGGRRGEGLIHTDLSSLTSESTDQFWSIGYIPPLANHALVIVWGFMSVYTYILCVCV